MFGELGPSLKNLLTKANIWIRSQTIRLLNLDGTTQTGLKLDNTTLAAAGVTQVSPSLEWEGRVWNTNSSTSTPVNFRSYLIPIQGAPGYLTWRSQYSINNAAPVNAFDWSSSSTIGKPLFINYSDVQISSDNSSTVDTRLTLDVRSSGSTNHIGMRFGTTIRSSWSVNTTGYTEWKTAGSNPFHNFYIGSSITSQTLIAQIYGSGYYSAYNAFIGQKVTAGSADQSVQTTLSTYGSFAAKGKLVTDSTYTLAETETFVYIDPSNAQVCSGTPTAACSSYSTETPCNAHSGVGCSWFAGNSCSPGSGTDQGTCEGQGAGCTWDSVTCSGADNTDQTTCEAQDDTYGGSCSWNTSTCPSYTDQGTCEAETGCTWNFSPCSNFNGQSQGTCEGNVGCTWTGGDCHTFDNSDQTTCETSHTGCSWGPGAFDCHTQDGTDQGTCEANTGCQWNSGNSTCFGLCNGVYDEGSTCSGQYDTSCSGNLCDGTFYNGNCSGTYGAGCQGIANCNNLTDDGQTACNAESGCLWVTGITVTLPTNANANRSNTGRMYSIMHVGNTGTAIIQGQSGEPIFQYTTLPLFKKGDKVILHNQNISFPCSVLSTQTPCEAQTGCSWTGQDCGAFSGTDSSTCTTGHSGCSWSDPSCSTYMDQTTCESNSCYWNGSTCGGVCSGTWGFSCTGTYSNGSYWYAHSLERGLNYVEKTANYTVTSIDDVINCTSGTFTLTLPDASLNNGKVFILKNLGTGVITLNTTSSQTIDGNASGVLTLNTGDSITVQSNNSNWIIT